MSDKKMIVTLVSPPSRIMNHYRPPLAPMYLSGYLKHCGIESKIIDITFRSQVRNKAFCENKDHYLAGVEDEIIRRVGSVDTDIVGITCYTPELLEVERLAGRIKSIKKNVTIIAGGIHPTLYPRDFLNSASSFDFVVIGEGELIFANLVQAIRSGNNNHKKVKGVGYFDRESGQVVITDSQPLVENLDEISFPDYEDLDMDFYTTPSPYAIRGVFTKSFYILSSRGCPSSCTFCVSKKLREHYTNQKFVRFRSPMLLFNEIQDLREKYKIDSFYFIDDLFTLNKDNVYEFCDLMVRAKSFLIWGCSSKVNTVDYDMLKRMKEAGCIQIDFGVEKGSDEALKYLKKGITVERIKQTFRYCHELGIRTFANMLVNTPGEKDADLQDAVNLVKEIKPEVVQFNIFAPYPGCEIFDEFSQNLKKEDYPKLMNSALYISEMPDKFRFASHSQDVLSWVIEKNKKYNRIFPSLSVHLKPRYLNSALHSKKKIDYFKQINSLLKEFINQKFISLKVQESKDVKCRFCSSKRVRLLFFAKELHGRHTLSQEQFGIYICQNCKFVFTDVKINGEYYKKYYRQDYYEHKLNNEFLIKILYLIRKSGFRYKFRWIKKCAPQGKKVLEIGCGQGDFLHWLPPSFKKNAIEINETARQYIKKHYRDIDVYDKQIDSEVFNDNNRYDIIIMWHTLEHINNPINLIRNCSNIIAKDGIIIFNLPNKNSLGFRLTKRHWFHLDAPRHLFYYDYENIRYLFRKYNFELIGYRGDFIDYFQDLSVSFYEKFKTNIFLLNILVAILIIPTTFIIRLFTALFFPGISEVNIYIARNNGGVGNN